jgi:hypothetical protein
MTLAQRKQERRALMKHLLAQDWDVFGTLKFVNGRSIGRNTADKLLRSYWNRVDRVFFGHAADHQNMRVPRWCFAHDGSDSENFHVHFLLKSPIADLEHACCVLNAIWAQHHRQTGPMNKNWIMPVIDRWEVANYATREYWRMGADTQLLDITWDAGRPEAMLAYQHEQQALRINKAASPIWMQQAEIAFADYWARYVSGGVSALA